jgi:hypothetical protein
MRTSSETMTTPNCYLENLSPELLFPILAYLPDLESLSSLLRASPGAYRLFNTQPNGPAIFEAVLSSGSTHKYTCALIRIIALIRADALPPTVHDFITMKDLILHETSPHRWDPQRWVHPQTILPSDISTSVLRTLLATNRKIQRLAFGCLDFYLNRFRSLKPFNSAGFSFDSTPFAEWDGDLIGPWQEKPANSVYYYPVQDIGRPSWLEQQRVVRVFWRIQLSHDLKAAVDSSRIVWPEMDEEGYMRVDNIGPADLCDAPGFFMDDAGGFLLDAEEILERETLLEHELLETAIQYTREVQEGIDDAAYWQLKKDWATASTPRSPEDCVALDLTFRSNMWSYFYELTGRPGWHIMDSVSPLQHVKFDLFRRFGFTIWSTARMAAYGLLLARDEYAAGMHPPYFEAWRNLLTQEERDSVDKEIKRRNEEALAAPSM